MSEQLEDNKPEDAIAPHADDDGLGAALLERFLKGVNVDGWQIVCLGSARAMALGPQVARQIGGGVDPDRLILLIAERPVK